MSTPYQPPTDGSEQRNDLIMRETEAEPIEDKSNVGTSVRDMAARIPEQLSARSEEHTSELQSPQ